MRPCKKTIYQILLTIPSNFMAKYNAITKSEIFVAIIKGSEITKDVKNQAADILLKKEEKTLNTCGFKNSPCINLN